MIAQVQKDGAEAFVQSWNEVMDCIDAMSGLLASAR